MKLGAPVLTAARQPARSIAHSSIPSPQQRSQVVPRQKKPRKGQVNISAARTSSKVQPWACFRGHDRKQPGQGSAPRSAWRGVQLALLWGKRDASQWSPGPIGSHIDGRGVWNCLNKGLKNRMSCDPPSPSPSLRR